MGIQRAGVDMRKVLLTVGMVLGAAFTLAGCVSIQDNVQVDRTTATNTNQNITQKCPKKPSVARTLLANGSAGFQSPGLVRDKAVFEGAWNQITLDATQEAYTKVEGTNKPYVDWNTQQVFFWSMGKVDNTCRKIVPVRVETDCLNIFLVAAQFNMQKDCKSTETYPVFIYLMPRTDLPIQAQWADDADGDGFSNESEIKVGTDPLDANSHP